MDHFLKRYRSKVRQVEDGRFDGASEAERSDAVQDRIRTSCTTAAALAIQPVPFADTAVLVPIHLRLLRDIARLRGERLDRKAGLELLWKLRANLVTHLGMAAAKFVPYLGWIFTVSAAHGLTYAVGQAADCYFRRHGEIPKDELDATLLRLYREDFERVYRHRRAELRAKMGRAPQVRRALRDLDADCREGRIDIREKARRREEVLDAG